MRCQSRLFHIAMHKDSGLLGMHFLGPACMNEPVYSPTSTSFLHVRITNPFCISVIWTGTHQTGWKVLEVVPSFPLYCQTAELG